VLPQRGAEWAPRQYWLAPEPLNIEGRGVDLSEPPLAVWLDNGRWVIGCPDCGGAQLACETDPRFLCHECGNVTVGGAWRRIAWPADRDGIETAVQHRLPKNRNWFPHETVSDLDEQNREHGVRDPRGNGEPREGGR
jgi:hypothetical protein